MITDKTKWDDENYYNNNFEDIMYDKLSNHKTLSYGDLTQIVNTEELIVDQTAIVYEIHSDIKVIVQLREKCYAIQYWNYNDGFKWYPKQPYEVKEHTTTVTEWVPVNQDS